MDRISHATSRRSCGRQPVIGADGNHSSGRLGLDTASLPLYDTARTFRAGHRIWLIVAGGSFPQFTRSPGTEANPLTATQLKPNRHTVRHADGASDLVPPVARSVV